MLVGGTRQPAQAPPSSPRMVWEREPVAWVSASRPAAARVVGRGVLVGEGVDRGEGGLCGGSVAPGHCPCLDPGPGRRLSGIGGFRWETGFGRACVLRLLFEAPPRRVGNRGGRVGRKSFPPAGAAQVRGPSFVGAGGHRVDHQIVRAVLANGLARGRAQRSFPSVLILQAMRERHCGQIERWRTFAVRHWRDHRSRHRGHSPIRRLRLCVTVLPRFAVHPMRRAPVCHVASCGWPGPTIACVISCRSMSRMSSQGVRSR